MSPSEGQAPGPRVHAWRKAYHCAVETREPDERERREWEAEFEAAARRPLRTRLRYAFIHTHKPVLDDATYRSFGSTAEYRARCARKPPTV